MKNIKTFRKKGLKIFLSMIVLALIGMILIGGIDAWVTKKAEANMYSQVSTIPSKRVGLLLGTAKYLKSGYENLYYRYRIKAAEQLYRAGKIEYILVSGDNGRTDYDEPSLMKEDLVDLGIPAERIFLDYAGFRTLDSVVRAKKVFGLQGFTLISQAFHNERALFLAQRQGLDCIAFNAKDVSARYGYRVVLREKLARIKMLLDLVVGKKPKFLGPQVVIG